MIALYIYFVYLLEDFALQRQMPNFWHWHEKRKERRRRRFFPIPGKTTEKIRVYGYDDLAVAHPKAKRFGGGFAGPIMERSTNGSGGATRSPDGWKTPIARRERRLTRQRLRQAVWLGEEWYDEIQAGNDSDRKYQYIKEVLEMMRKRRNDGNERTGTAGPEIIGGIIQPEPRDHEARQPEPEVDPDLEPDEEDEEEPDGADPIHAEVVAMMAGFSGGDPVAMHEFAGVLAAARVRNDKHLGIAIGQANARPSQRRKMVVFADDPDDPERTADAFLTRRIGREKIPAMKLVPTEIQALAAACL